jgi:hypothetical protein
MSVARRREGDRCCLQKKKRKESYILSSLFTSVPSHSPPFGRVHTSYASAHVHMSAAAIRICTSSTGRVVPPAVVRETVAASTTGAGRLGGGQEDLAPANPVRRGRGGTRPRATHDAEDRTSHADEDPFSQTARRCLR